MPSGQLVVAHWHLELLGGKPKKGFKLGLAHLHSILWHPSCASSCPPSVKSLTSSILSLLGNVLGWASASSSSALLKAPGASRSPPCAPPSWYSPRSHSPRPKTPWRGASIPSWFISMQVAGSTWEIVLRKNGPISLYRLNNPSFAWHSILSSCSVRGSFHYSSYVEVGAGKSGEIRLTSSRKAPGQKTHNSLLQYQSYLAGIPTSIQILRIMLPISTDRKLRLQLQ